MMPSTALESVPLRTNTSVQRKGHAYLQPSALECKVLFHGFLLVEQLLPELLVPIHQHWIDNVCGTKRELAISGVKARKARTCDFGDRERCAMRAAHAEELALRQTEVELA